ncbi:MAG: hypothetical protein D6698_12720 [Gammaproteobacteria bacterium]|nr:MAG: hypothetical protein D6698_12720 [Gammaproteobacteria bacterium]
MTVKEIIQHLDDVSLYELSHKSGIRVELLEHWRIMKRNGIEVQDQIRDYRLGRVSPVKARKEGRCCAMCGIYFERPEGHPAVCNDCDKRRDRRPKMVIGSEYLTVFRAKNKEISVSL